MVDAEGIRVVQDMASLLQEKYEVGAERALEDAGKLLDVWKEQGVVE